MKKYSYIDLARTISMFAVILFHILLCFSNNPFWFVYADYENGHGIDFVFRYCNKQMEVVEGLPISEMLNHSFYEVLKNGDKKWLVGYADVALNGTSRTVCDFSPEIGKSLTIHCYQPEPGFCSCVLIPAESTNCEKD